MPLLAPLVDCQNEVVANTCMVMVTVLRLLPPTVAV
jgi:hypothetical protein